ncbi:MAG: glycosyltransferase family 4 protein [Eubacteriales bacterium]
MSLRVAHVIGGGEFGGAERHILNLAGAVDPQAVEITVCCLFEAPFAEIVAKAGISVAAFPMRHRLDMRVLDELAYFFRHGEFNIVHTHGVRANLLGRISARQAGKKVVTTVHSLLRSDYPGTFSRMANSLAEKLTRGMTDHFIAVSGGLKKALVKGGLPDGRVTVVYNGIDLEALAASRRPAVWRDKLGCTGGEPLVGMVARLHPVKGHRYFLEAAREVLAALPEARFVIAGEGPGREAMEQLAGRLGIEDSVVFTGFVEEVWPLMADLDLLVVPSLWEGFGLTAVEALALGVPVVAADVGGLPEAVRHGETGLLVAPGDTAALSRGIIWMLEHPSEAAEMARRGGEAVRREFSASTMAARTVEVYRKLLDGGPLIKRGFQRKASK